MKKLLSLLFIALPLSFAYVSCSDDDKDLPDVSMGITVSNAKILQNTIYVVQGETLIVDALNIKNNEAGKNAIITAAEYNFTHESFYTPFMPFTWKRPTSADPQSFYYIPCGEYELNIVVNIAAEDKALAIGVLPYIVKIVPSADDIPADATNSDSPYNNVYVKAK